MTVDMYPEYMKNPEHQQKGGYLPIYGRGIDDHPALLWMKNGWGCSFGLVQVSGFLSSLSLSIALPLS